MRRAKKKILAAIMMMAISGIPAYAAEWKQEGDTWQYQNDDGSYETGWNWIAGKSYYFDNDGNMLANTITPDGYQVNENGEWVVGGVVQTQEEQRRGTVTRQFGSLIDSMTKGYWSDKNNLTWTWWDGSGSVVIGNGPKYSDLYPEVTDREYLLKEYVNYPGEGLTNLNSWGEPKANFDEDDLQLLREFVNSFDWINSDELTRAKAIHDRIAVGNHGNKYGSTKASTGAWSVLQHKEGICMDYAGEYKRLADYIGLECVEYSPKINHEICMVRINGQWITLDPSMEVSFWDNGETVPVDFDIEYNRKDNEYKQSESGQRMKRLRELNQQLERGEVSEEEFERLANEIWS